MKSIWESKECKSERDYKIGLITGSNKSKQRSFGFLYDYLKGNRKAND